MQSEASSRLSRPLLLLTGATGYVGGRLLAALEAGGRRLRCVARRPEYLAGRFDPATERYIGAAGLRVEVRRSFMGDLVTMLTLRRDPVKVL